MTTTPAPPLNLIIPSGSDVGPWPTGFKYGAAEDVVVFLTIDGIKQSDLAPSDFTLTGGSPTVNGGSVTLNSGVVPLGGWQSGGVAHRVVIQRRTIRRQGLALPDTEGHKPRQTEAALDKMMRLHEEQADTAGRALSVPIGEAGVQLGRITERRGKLFAFDAQGRPLTNRDLVQFDADVANTAEARGQVLLVADQVAAALTAANDRAAAALAARNAAEEFANNAVLQANVPVFASLAALGATSVPAQMKAINTQFREPNFAVLATLGGGAQYVRVSKVVIDAAGYPASAWRRSTDRFMPDGTTHATNGGYWVIANHELNAQMFGAVGDGTITDDTQAIQDCIDFARVTGRKVRSIGEFRTEGKIYVNCHYDGSAETWNVYGSPDIALEISSGEDAENGTALDIFELTHQFQIILPSLKNRDKTGLGWTGFGTGVRYCNMQNAIVFERLVKDFAIGIQAASFHQMCGYNTVFGGYLYNNKINRQLICHTPEGGTNRWDFIGGRYFHGTAESAPTPGHPGWYDLVEGCMHIDVVPSEFNSIINDINFIGGSIEGNIEWWHVRLGGMEIDIKMRFEDPRGPRIHRATVNGRGGQGGNCVIDFSNGVDETYLDITHDAGASDRMTVNSASGTGRRVKGGPDRLMNTADANGAVDAVYAPTVNLDDEAQAQSRWSIWRAANFMAGKGPDDPYARWMIDNLTGRLKTSNGSVAPFAGIGGFGSGNDKYELFGYGYEAAQALAPGNVFGMAARWYSTDGRWHGMTPGGTDKVFAAGVRDTGWTAATGTVNKAGFSVAAIAALTFSNPPTQAECNALRDALVAVAGTVRGHDGVMRAFDQID